MADTASITFLTVGTSPQLIAGLWSRIESQGGHRFAHLVHPGLDRRAWPGGILPPNVQLFTDDLRAPLPQADERWLASLAGDGVPTLHNMILGDRVVSKLPYGDALRYATMLARRLAQAYETLKPQAVIGSFDALHSGLSLAVARAMGLPWVALHFSVMPPGMACLCDGLSPAARVDLQPRDHAANLALAEETLARFERRQVQATAYLAPAPRSLAGRVANAPQRVAATWRTLRRWPERHHLRFSVPASAYSLGSALGVLRRLSAARAAASDPGLLTSPPAHPFVLFGLHMQPESSIDVWAPFYSNQKWVIELLSRSLPPTHRLLVKIHKSDVARYTREELREIRQLPGVELVAPFADARQFIQGADLIMQIQGTIGLEAALLGKPVIMLGESPFTLFPSVSGAGRIGDLPALVLEKLRMAPVRREAIIESFARYLAPFEAASDNDWQAEKTPQQIGGYCRLFDRLLEHLRHRGAGARQTASARVGALPC